jgi:nucleoside-diphosphate-sugar epimerase
MASAEAAVRALVLGGAGFIGSHVAAALLRQGVRVTVLDGFLPDSAARDSNLAPIKGHIRLIRSRVEDCTEFPEVLRDADVVIDCMGLTAHHIGMADPLRDLERNLRSHVVLIEALRLAPGRRVIYLGSRGQYGRAAARPITEETPQIPADVQGVHKLAAESLFRVYADRQAFQVAALRLSNTFGEHQRTDGEDLGLVGGFIRDLLGGRRVEVFGDRARTKALVYVRDLAEIVASMAVRPFDREFSAYNVAGTEVQLGSLLDSLVGEVGAGTWAVAPFPEQVRQMDGGDAPYSDARLRQALGRVPQTDLAEALRNTVAYFKRAQREPVG